MVLVKLLLVRNIVQVNLSLILQEWFILTANTDYKAMVKPLFMLRKEEPRMKPYHRHRMKLLSQLLLLHHTITVI